MINRLSNLINRNRSAAKISQVLCSNLYTNCIVKKRFLEEWYEHTFKLSGLDLDLSFQDYLAGRMKEAQISVTSFIEMQGTVFIQIGKKQLSLA